MDSKKIRNTFLDFFGNKGHKIVPSSSMVVKDDPTLMFTNAGMNQFKDVFLGNIKPSNKRVADTQKCLRVSGKHNDLDEVGVDTYHHTMFEMLGNWSFGDYFKKDAINWAWELLVDVYGVDKERLYVTVFGGDAKAGLGSDAEAIDYWKKHISTKRILPFDRKDNFWEMGDIGPCGPCSEIHVDLREEKERAAIDGKTLVNIGHPEVIEIWNLVFIEYSRLSNGKLEPLPEKHIDTGMGFERLCMVLQGKKSNYDTDIFQPVIKELEKHCNNVYGADEKTDIAIRVIADHLRAVSFSIADGQLPFREGAGYVIRRILRRAVRYGYSFLELKHPFIYQLVPVLVEQLGSQFPELISQQKLITKVIKDEELSFLRTLEKGMKKLVDVNTAISGKFAFELYDTFGFPVDLTQLIASEKSLEVDLEGFAVEMEKQKTRARKDGEMEMEDWVVVHKGEKPAFVGYEMNEAEVKILKYRKVISKGLATYHLLFDRTPFYAESGGQVGDSGLIQSADEKIEVLDTQKENNLWIHMVKDLPLDLSASFLAKIDLSRRRLTEKNHSATHLMHAALREVLGLHVEQKGSLVHPDYLRFDFSHFEKVGVKELKEIEHLVNEKIKENIVLETKVVPIEDAKNMGAMALFGEKYGDIVRVVIFSEEYSIELCGGTHVEETKQIEAFKIISESSIAAGVRRIEAVTAEKALSTIDNQKIMMEKLLADIQAATKYGIEIEMEDSVNEITSSQLKDKIALARKVLGHIDDLKIPEQLKFKKDLLSGGLNEKDLEERIQAYLSLNSNLNKYLNKLVQKYSAILREDLKDKITATDGVNTIAEKISGLDADSLKNIALQLRKEIDNAFIMLGGEDEGKVFLALAISESLIESRSLNAAEIIREIASEIKGGGGGQPFFATAGGSNADGLPVAFKKALLHL
ncbi:MAG TPA: alanine--tRNA ligase [Flavobacteriales bacterium]|nr:alanine--tRNA ligase [Flavobacteriales bacterium]